jgi:PAS domain S-box-containing protein
MADLATEGLYLVDRVGRFLYVNAQGLAQMGGYTMDEFLRLTVVDISPDLTPEAFEANVQALVQGPMPTIESRTRRKDGSTFPVEVSTARLDVNGEVYMFGVARDVSERKAAATARKRLAGQLLETIERERQRVARELHDDVGQAVATVGILIDTLELQPEAGPESGRRADAIPKSVRLALASTRATIRQITESLARIIREYHPAELLGLGLADTLRTHVRQLAERHGLRWRFSTVPVEGLLTPDSELQIYRVVQEALANTARHARASAVDIAITQTPDHLVIRVHDDGTGFPPDAIGHGVGLATMRERAMLLRATLTIESAPGAGTTVTLDVPLAPEPPFDGEPSWRTAMRFVRSPVAPERPASLPPALDLDVFRQMADMASEAFELVDHTGRFVYVNDRACQITGYTREELLKRRVSDIDPNFPQTAWDQWAAAAQGPVPTFGSRNRRRDGVIIPVEVSSTPITVRGERYFFAVVRDVSDRRDVETAERGFTRRLLHTLEAERERVARELHDEVGQAIATVGVLLHTLESTPGTTPESSQELAATHATIRQITESVARIVRDYHPEELEALGLEDTLRTHARQFTQRHGLALRLSTTAVDDLLSAEQSLHLYRIVQEALANVVRHSGARRVSVRLARVGSRVAATVNDDGIGFDPDANRVGGLGLVTMRERAELIGATLVIRSRPGRGTEVRVTLAGDAVRDDADA